MPPGFFQCFCVNKQAYHVTLKKKKKITGFTSLDVDIWCKRAEYTVMDSDQRFPKVLM